jgi:hypothetical protein
MPKTKTRLRIGLHAQIQEITGRDLAMERGTFENISLTGTHPAIHARIHCHATSTRQLKTFVRADDEDSDNAPSLDARNA